MQTYVLEHDWGVLAEAIRRELSRGGQVYYLHNRVDNIESCAAHVSQMVPGARVGIAHGKMTEEELTEALKAIIAQVGATTPQEMGKVMGVATKQLAGRADGRAISAKVKELLA